MTCSSYTWGMNVRVSRRGRRCDGGRSRGRLPPACGHGAAQPVRWARSRRAAVRRDPRALHQPAAPVRRVRAGVHVRRKVTGEPHHPGGQPSPIASCTTNPRDGHHGEYQAQPVDAEPVTCPLPGRPACPRPGARPCRRADSGAGLEQLRDTLRGHIEHLGDVPAGQPRLPQSARCFT